MKKFNNWPWKIKIIGPIAYSIVICSVFAYDTFTEFETGKAFSLIIIIAGYSSMIIARIQLRDRFTIEPSASTQKTIIRSGLYGVVRHPVYTSVSLAVIGMTIYLLFTPISIWVNIFSFIFSISYIIMQVVRARNEEKILVKAHGNEYVDYQKSTLF